MSFSFQDSTTTSKVHMRIEVHAPEEGVELRHSSPGTCTDGLITGHIQSALEPIGFHNDDCSDLGSCIFTPFVSSDCPTGCDDGDLPEREVPDRDESGEQLLVIFTDELSELEELLTAEGTLGAVEDEHAAEIKTLSPAIGEGEQRDNTPLHQTHHEDAVCSPIKDTFLHADLDDLTDPRDIAETSDDSSFAIKLTTFAPFKMPSSDPRYYVIGRGGFGSVYGCLHNNTTIDQPQPVLKCVSDLLSSGDRMQAAVYESLILFVPHARRHPHLLHGLQFIPSATKHDVKNTATKTAAVCQPDAICFVVPRCDGALSDLLNDNSISGANQKINTHPYAHTSTNRQHRLSLHDVQSIVCQLVAALHHMHSVLGYRHGDLKPANILYTLEGDAGERRFCIQLCDFGNARPLISSTFPPATAPYTPQKDHLCYPAAAQQNDDGQYRRLVAAFDAYSLGVVMGDLLLEALADLLGLCPSAEAVAACLNSRTGEHCRLFLVALLDGNPAARLTMQEALQHPYLSGIVGSSSLTNPYGNVFSIPSIAALERDEATAKAPAAYFKQLFAAHYHGGDVTFAPVDNT